MELKSLKDMVLWELENHEGTRSSDRELIRCLYRDFYKIGNNHYWVDVMLRYDLPSFESIRRCRQKIQQERVDLRAVEEIEEARINKQVEYLDFVKGEN